MAKGGIKGDFRPLADIIKRAGRVASGELAEKSAHTFGRKIFELNSKTIAAGTSPAGGRWKPTVRGGRALAGASGRLRIIYWKGGFKLVLEAPHRYHQTGAYRPNRDGGGALLFGRKKSEWRLPARPLLPRRGGGIPRKWREPVIKELQAEWYRAWKR